VILRLVVSKIPNAMLATSFVLLLLTELVMAGCSPAPTLPPGDAGQSTYQLAFNLLGDKDEFFVDSQGRLKSKAEISSADGRIALSAEKGTAFLDKDGSPLQIMHIAVEDDPPPPPRDTYLVSPVYSLQPQGAVSKPGLLLTLRYDPARLIGEVEENELGIFYHDGSKWNMMRYKKIDTERHLITTQLYDLNATIFAILGPKPQAPATPRGPTQGTRVGDLAPDFQLDNLRRESVSLAQFRGQPVLLNFWASWCGPCRQEMPFLQEIYENQELQDKGLVILAVNIGESPATAESFMEAGGFSFSVLLDINNSVAGKYNIRGIPATFFIDKDGIIKDVKVGAFASTMEIMQKLANSILTE